MIDWNAYRGVFEEEASRILGRDVRVGGKVNLRLLPSPYVRFEKVRISDAGAALGEPFFRAEAFTLWLSPTPLLRGAIEASELELDRPVLRLAVDAEGRGNWQALEDHAGRDAVHAERRRAAAGAHPQRDRLAEDARARRAADAVGHRRRGCRRPRSMAPTGSAAWSTGTARSREIRIGTSQREADGKLRYKASGPRSPDSGNHLRRRRRRCPSVTPRRATPGR